MKVLNWNHLHEVACAAENMFGVYTSDFGLFETPNSEVIRTFVIGALQKIIEVEDDFYNILQALNCDELMLFETEEEARKVYEIFEQELTDSSSVYACLYSPTQGCLTENT